MANNYYLYVNESTDPYYNLAMEEYVLTHFMNGSIFLLWQNQNTIVVGRHQNTLEEINRAFVEEHDIKVVRRTTGGGAVYHDLGNLNYSFIVDREKNGDKGMADFALPVIRTLEQMGVEAEFGGRNDIMVGDSKISGTAQRIYANRILHHGCLLFDADLEMVGKALTVKAEKFKSKAVKSVRSRVGNIAEFLPRKYTMEEFKEQLISVILADEKFEQLTFGDKDLAAIRELRDTKYATWDWNYGQSMDYAIHNAKRFAAGTLDVYLNICKGHIKTCMIYGDFMAMRPFSDIAEKLVGCKYTVAEVLNCLEQFEIYEYFGDIAAREIARCICCEEG